MGFLAVQTQVDTGHVALALDRKVYYVDGSRSVQCAPQNPDIKFELQGASWQ